MIVSTEQKRKLGVIFLLVFGHELELLAISRDKVCKLVDDILQLLIYAQRGDAMQASTSWETNKPSKKVFKHQP